MAVTGFDWLIVALLFTAVAVYAVLAGIMYMIGDGD